MEEPSSNALKSLIEYRIVRLLILYVIYAFFCLIASSFTENLIWLLMFYYAPEILFGIAENLWHGSLEVKFKVFLSLILILPLLGSLLFVVTKKANMLMFVFSLISLSLWVAIITLGYMVQNI